MSIKFDGDRAYRHLEVLVDEIGPRHGSSEAEAAAAACINDYFKGLGLESQLSEYPI